MAPLCSSSTVADPYYPPRGEFLDSWSSQPWCGFASQEVFQSSRLAIGSKWETDKRFRERAEQLREVRTRIGIVNRDADFEDAHP
jgi:hypothetical protein